eukprot:GEMP01062675.1.p1 GENE.GEMP01062675.1~~GEMP01062675.1.p1  ORF type:complete len:302 (+),score=24.68 GEMP01062675.1:29-934(+)
MELWIRRDSLPKRGKQHNSELVQVRRILGCALGVHPDCPQDGGVVRVDHHTQLPEYLIALFCTPDVATIALNIFHGMNLGYKITENLDFKPINLVVERPLSKSAIEKNLAANEPTPPMLVMEEFVREERCYDFRNTIVYVMNKHGSRHEVVVGIDKENNLILQDGTRLSRASHTLKRLGISFRFSTPPQRRVAKRRADHLDERRKPAKKSKRSDTLLDDIERVLVEIHGPGERVRTRFLPQAMTMGEIVTRCGCDVKNVSVLDTTTNYVLSKDVSLTDYLGRGHVQISLQPATLFVQTFSC